MTYFDYLLNGFLFVLTCVGLVGAFFSAMLATVDNLRNAVLLAVASTIVGALMVAFSVATLYYRSSIGVGF